MTTELEKQLAAERERADYAWRNTRTIEAACQEEMNKRDVAEREVALLREALEPFADIRAANIDALPDSSGFAARSNGGHVTYGDIRRARELLRSNDQAQGAAQGLLRGVPLDGWVRPQTETAMTELEAAKKKVAHYCKEAMESATIASAYAEEAAKLRAFANAVLGDWPDCGTLDGGDIQTLAENHGLLTPTTPCEPCGESCACLEYYGADDFARGEVLCYRKTRLLLGPN